METNQINIINVLLADDHAVVRAGIRQFLELDSGIKVIAECSDGNEACRLTIETQPDVVILDIQMPGMNGIDVTRWLRGKGYRSAILVLTAYEDAPYVQAVLKAGANGYALKTASPAEIIQSVRDVFAGKSVLDASLAMRLIRQNNEPPPQPLVDALSEREIQILTFVARGLTNKAIGAQLYISDRTVQNHLAHIFSKLNAASRTEAVMRAVSLGLIDPPEDGAFSP
jgi:DNA-binding NarL/FixJ family response regulator